MPHWENPESFWDRGNIISCVLFISVVVKVTIDTEVNNTLIQYP